MSYSRSRGWIILGWLLDLVYPRRCVGCQRAGGYLCAACFAPGPACPRCGMLARCRCWRGSALDSAYSLGTYDGALATAIRRMKYNGVSDIGRELGRWLKPLIEPGELLAPVPLHSRRERDRGFNQAGVLARAAARRATVWQGLVRVRETESQVGLSAAARRRNLKGAFAVRGQAPADLILIDDVLTTGSTLDECARTLRAAGARSVRALVVAHARPGWDR